MRHHDVRFARLAPLLALLLLAAGTTDASAQHHGHRRQARSVIGMQFIWADPQGEFGYFVDEGYGLGGHAVLNLSRHGGIGLRMDGTFIVYGHEHFSEPLSPSIPRVWVDVTTDNLIASGFIGPQITLGHGDLRPYVHGGFGFSYFATRSSVDDGSCCGYGHIATTNFDDWTPAVTGGGGLYLALSRHVLIDVSAQYVHNAKVEYMREGGIIEDPDGSLWLEVIESDVNLWVWKLGVTFAIG